MTHDTHAFFRQPQLVLIEKEFIGGILHAPWVLDQLDHSIHEDDLQLSESRIVFRILREQLNKGEVFSIPDVYQEMIRLGDQAKDISPFFAECIDLDPTGASASNRAKLLREASMMRQAWALAHDLKNEAEHPRGEPSAVIDDYIRELEKITQAESNGPVHISTVLTEVQQRLDQRMRGDYPDPVQSGIFDLDELTDGFHSGEFIVIAARPSMGKTSLGLQYAENIVRFNDPVLFFSLEMDRAKIAERLLLFAGLDYSVFKSKSLQPHQIAKVTQTCSQLQDLPFYIDHGSGLKLSQIISRSRYFRRKHKVRAIVVDYLQLVSKDSYQQSEYEHVTQVSKSLKNLSKQLEIPVIALAQLNRDNEKNGNRRPRLSDLRSSGQIEQDADKVIFIHRERDDNDRISPNTEIIVAKNRNGDTGLIEMTFKGSTMRFDKKEIRTI